MNIDATVQKIIFALIRRWKLLLIFTIIGGIIGYFYTANFTTLTYTSDVKFLAYVVDTNQEISDDNNKSMSSEYVRTSNTSKMNYVMGMLPTYIEIMKTNEFNELVASDLNERINSNYSAGVIKNAITIESVGSTAMFVMTVKTTDPSLSYEIAHQLETSVGKMMKDTNNGLVKVEVKDKAVRNDNAGSFGYPKKCAIAAVAGFVLAAAYVILRNILDVRIRTEQELVEKYNIPVLGSIPNFENKYSSSGSSRKKVDGK